ncbi:energy-coupling factor transporter ATPase [Alkalibacillus silvisoli]|uniref:Energy-coupling factor ABC transporter ATP-binding protein n=1 Tax=Alkalibacillus silvisoli TaxID=392823 RepID=A0ABN1A933_9BACI
MEILSMENVGFTYPDSNEEVLKSINFTIHKGDFIVLCGSSGSGKSTLLRLIKHDLAPHGDLQGDIYYKEKRLEDHSPIRRAKEIGMVFQDPENQIVMDTVMNELLFGLENMGYSTPEMNKKIAEMTQFFGLNGLLKKKTDELSGGEKQLVNLVSVLLLDPDIILLDEPTSQLDPIAAKEFIYTLERLNDEFGITVLIVEHRLEDLFTVAEYVMVMDEGRISYIDMPEEVVKKLINHPTLSRFLPSASRIFLNFSESNESKQIPITVKEAQGWLETQVIHPSKTMEKTRDVNKNILKLKEIDFQYVKRVPPVLHNLSLNVCKGEWHAILGANGTGKSTLLKIIAGLLKHQHGSIKYDGKKIKNNYHEIVSYLPQNPALYFVQDTLMKEYRMLARHFQIENANEKISQLLNQFQIYDLKDRHPHDLSGGQLQKAALIGTLLTQPAILLIDEPTKGLDPESKSRLAEVLRTLIKDGLTIVMVTHDVEFAASYSSRSSLLFQGQITTTEDTRKFFKENMYYTTTVNRITRKSNAPSVITIEEANEKWHVQKDY